MNPFGYRKGLPIHACVHNIFVAYVAYNKNVVYVAEMTVGMILNEKELREIRVRVSRLADALSSEGSVKQMTVGLPSEVVVQVTEMMKSERKNLLDSIEAYESARDTGNASLLQQRASSDPGLTLIVARIAKGYSQRDLAWRLGIKEQQVQRYEADRYSTISLKNYARVAALLGVHIKATIQENPEFRGLDKIIADVSKEDIKKIIRHGRARGWFSEDMSESELRQYIAENRIQFGSPSLLRTGLNVTDHSEDVLLHAWRARVASRARNIISKELATFDPLDIGWLPDLVRLSAFDDGPVRAIELLAHHGIIVIAESQIPGLAIDGAAFLEENVPVIGLTIRRDTVDNFWFTLLHELAHVLLHYRTGLSTGFYDQEDATSADEQEAEADKFAGNLLIPGERWARSTARIANSPDVIERFAKELGIHPAIAFGRIRKERNNYTIFANKIGGNTVRAQLMEQS